MSAPPPKALLVTDAHGQLIDRIGRSWVRLGQGLEFEIIRSQEASPALLCQEAVKAGFVFWLDFRRFCQVARSVPVPQAVLVHHVVDAEESRAVAALKEADALATSSVRWQKRLAEWTGREAALIPYAVDANHFGSAEPRPSPTGAPFILGFIGKGAANLNDRKGTALLVETLQALKCQNRPFELLLVGPGWDELENRVRGQGISVRRTQFDTTEETITAYAAMDALMVTAQEEGGPVTILEAMACGVPVVTTDVGHVPEVIKHGETGLICRDRLPTTLAGCVASLMADAAMRDQITAKARAFVENNRDQHHVLPGIDFEAVYREAMEAFSRRSPEELRRRHRRAGWLAFRHKVAGILHKGGIRPD